MSNYNLKILGLTSQKLKHTIMNLYLLYYIFNLYKKRKHCFFKAIKNLKKNTNNEHMTIKNLLMYYFNCYLLN